MRGTRPRHAVSLVLASLLGLGFGLFASHRWWQPAATVAARSPFVTRDGTSFALSGRPFRFVGFNIYDAAATPRFQCAPWPRWSDAELDSDLHYLHDAAGMTVLRFWAYQTYTAGGTDWSGVDRVLRIAAANGIHVILALEDGPGNCTTGRPHQAKIGYEGDTWYSTGYRKPLGNARLSYRDYVARIVAHYAGNPTIFAWMMMNEAETHQRDNAGRSQLVDFATDIGGLIKAIDPNHLITVGTQSNGAPGGSGQDFAAIYGVPSVDFAEVHDWAAYGSDSQPLPGSPDGHTPPSAGSSSCSGRDGTRIACSFALARQVLHKPIIVGEAGIKATAGSYQRRADELGAKLLADFQAGASGYLVWQYNKVFDSALDVQRTTADPLIPRLRQLAEQVGALPH